MVVPRLFLNRTALRLSDRSLFSFERTSSQGARHGRSPQAKPGGPGPVSLDRRKRFSPCLPAARPDPPKVRPVHSTPQRLTRHCQCRFPARLVLCLPARLGAPDRPPELRADKPFLRCLDWLAERQFGTLLG